MATTPTITGAVRGIANTLSGYVVQSENFTESPVVEQVPDQLGAIGYEAVYDHRVDLSLSVISAGASITAPTVTNEIISYASHNWFVDSCEEAGTYNGVRKWNIKAHRYDNWPDQSSGTTTNGSGGSGD